MSLGADSTSRMAVLFLPTRVARFRSCTKKAARDASGFEGAVVHGGGAANYNLRDPCERRYVF